MGSTALAELTRRHAMGSSSAVGTAVASIAAADVAAVAVAAAAAAIAVVVFVVTPAADTAVVAAAAATTAVVCGLDMLESSRGPTSAAPTAITTAVAPSDSGDGDNSTANRLAASLLPVVPAATVAVAAGVSPCAPGGKDLRGSGLTLHTTTAGGDDSSFFRELEGAAVPAVVKEGVSELCAMFSSPPTHRSTCTWARERWIHRPQRGHSTKREPSLAERQRLLPAPRVVAGGEARRPR